MNREVKIKIDVENMLEFEEKINRVNKLIKETQNTIDDFCNYISNLSIISSSEIEERKSSKEE